MARRHQTAHSVASVSQHGVVSTPSLKQFIELTRDDFDRSPIWVGCHTADYDESWYEETDEETFRPWSGRLPVDPVDGMFLVRATASLHDGTSLVAFLTPASRVDDLGRDCPIFGVTGLDGCH